MEERMMGVVSWFSNSRGYGFVTPDDGSKDIFAHFSNVTMNGYKTLKEGQRVEFEIGEIEGKGRNALNIVILDTEVETEEE
jgi:CspA family cold shock protein